MVIKLVKRDMRDSKKYYVPILIIIVALFTLLGLMIRSFDGSYYSDVANIVGALSVVGIVALTFGLLILSVLANIYILYTSVYGDRGYDLFTMPVTSGQIIISKMLTIFFWSVLSMVAVGIGFFFFLATTNLLNEFFIGLQILLENLSYIFADLDMTNVAIFGLSAVVSWFFTAALMLFAGAVANSSKFQKNRGIIAVGIYYLIVFSLNLIQTLVIKESMTQIFFQGNSTVVLISALFDLLIVGVLLFGVKWLWDNKLEIL